MDVMQWTQQDCYDRWWSRLRELHRRSTLDSTPSLNFDSPPTADSYIPDMLPLPSVDQLRPSSPLYSPPLDEVGKLAYCRYPAPCWPWSLSVQASWGRESKVDFEPAYWTWSLYYPQTRKCWAWRSYLEAGSWRWLIWPIPSDRLTHRSQMDSSSRVQTRSGETWGRSASAAARETAECCFGFLSRHSH